MADPPRHILFVCTGNICRSPMAEHLFRHRMRDRSEWTASSAGLFALHGSPASAAAVDALREWGIDLSLHQSQPVTALLVNTAGLIAVMTEQHRQEFLALFPQAAERVRLLGSFGTGREARDIADPIGQSLHVYRTVRDQIDSALADLILHLIERDGGAPR